MLPLWNLWNRDLRVQDWIFVDCLLTSKLKRYVFDSCLFLKTFCSRLLRLVLNARCSQIWSWYEMVSTNNYFPDMGVVDFNVMSFVDVVWGLGDQS